VTTIYRSLSHKDYFSQSRSSVRYLVTSSNDGLSSVPRLTSSQTGGHLTPTSYSCNCHLNSFESQSQSYFATGGLAPINSSWRQAPWDPRLEIFLFNRTLAVIVFYARSSWWEDGLFCYEHAWPFVKRTYRTYSMLLKILLFQLCTSQYMFCRTDHAYLTCFMV
jgi:hypothetical protein